MLFVVIISYLSILVQSHPDSFAEAKALSPDILSNAVSHHKSCTETAKKELTSGNWKGVLKTLQNETELNRCLDAQIAFTLVEKVIDNNAYEHYPFAEQIYFRALSTDPKPENNDIIKEEARKILPLLGDEEKKEWENKIKHADSALTDDLRAFWKLRDPVLSTSTNERLTEHWQRIAYARQEFTKNRESVYGTDDRGTIFVKYGSPSYKRSGVLFPDNGEIRSKLYDLSFFKSEISPREMFSLNMSIKQQYMPKYYEVWVYRNFGSPRPVLFIFGDSANRGTFGLRKSVEEFIPSTSFRMGITSSGRFGTGARGLNAGPFLQMALYNNLTTIDIFFGRQLSYYDQNWQRYLNGSLNFSSLKMLNSSSRAERELEQNQEQAPDESSTLKRRLGYIEQSYKLFRFLNEQNEPVSKIIVFSSPHEKLISNDATIFGHLKPSYNTRHSARIFDAAGMEIFSDTKILALKKDTETVKASLLEVPAIKPDQYKKPATLLLSSEISRIPNKKNQNEQSGRIIIASSVEKAPGVPALNGDAGALEVSDIIWGYASQETNHNVEELSFTIPQGIEIPQGQNIKMYFEAYHLSNDPGSGHTYQIDYYIHRKKRRKLIDTGIKLTLNFTSQYSTSKETLEVKTSDLEPGKYIITCQFRDTDSSHPVVRNIEFKIKK